MFIHSTDAGARWTPTVCQVLRWFGGSQWASLFKDLTWERRINTITTECTERDVVILGARERQPIWDDSLFETWVKASWRQWGGSCWGWVGVRVQAEAQRVQRSNVKRTGRVYGTEGGPARVEQRLWGIWFLVLMLNIMTMTKKGPGISSSGPGGASRAGLKCGIFT